MTIPLDSKNEPETIYSRLLKSSKKYSPYKVPSKNLIISGAAQQISGRGVSKSSIAYHKCFSFHLLMDGCHERDAENIDFVFVKSSKFLNSPRHPDQSIYKKLIKKLFLRLFFYKLGFKKNELLIICKLPKNLGPSKISASDYKFVFDDGKTPTVDTPEIFTKLIIGNSWFKLHYKNRYVKVFRVNNETKKLQIYNRDILIKDCFFSLAPPIGNRKSIEIIGFEKNRKELLIADLSKDDSSRAHLEVYCGQRKPYVYGLTNGADAISNRYTPSKFQKFARIPVKDIVRYSSKKENPVGHGEFLIKQNGKDRGGGNIVYWNGRVIIFRWSLDNDYFTCKATFASHVPVKQINFELEGSTILIKHGTDELAAKIECGKIAHIELKQM